MDVTELPEVLRQWANSRASEMWTAAPAVVKSYDSATQCADLELVVRAPLVLDEDAEDVRHEALPVIPNVRILFPSTGTVSITFPIAPGDEVLLIVSTLQLSEYRRTGKTSDAVDVRRNSLGCGGWAIPGVLKDAAILAAAADSGMVLRAPMIKLGDQAASDFVALASLVRALVGQLATAILNAAVTAGDGGAGLQTAAKGALTSAGWTGGGTTPPATATAATRVKAL